MSRASLGLALLLAIAGGCDREGRVDAGSDSGPAPEDASIDGGTEPLDAEVDGGQPDPLAMAVEAARDDATEAAAAQAALDPSVSMGVEFLQLDLAQVRVDAIIGEKLGSLLAAAGIIGEKSTLAFEPPVAATIVVLRQLRQAEIELAGVLALLDPTDAALAPLHAALTDELASLAALREQTLAYYEELIALAASLPGTEQPRYMDRRSIHTMPETGYVDAILEGSATDTDGSVSVSCARGSTAPLTVTVRDDRAPDSPLVSGTGAGPHDFVVRPDEPTTLRIELMLMGVPHDVCAVQVQGRRHLRAAATVLDTAQAADLAMLTSEWDSRMSTLTGTITMMRTEGDATDAALATIVEAHLREASSESGLWRGGLTSFAPEDLDVLSLTLTHAVIPLSTAFEAELATSTARFASSVRGLLAELRMRNEMALAIVAPAP